MRVCAMLVAAFLMLPSLPARAASEALRLDAPFATLFAQARKNPDVSVEGTLVRGDRAPERVTVSVRGHTSRRADECTFPKLKVEVTAGTSLRIGTHCGEAPAGRLTDKYGRVANDTSPRREAAVYAILAALDVPALQAQLVRITYTDTSDGESHAPIERYALLLEDDDDAARRLGGRGTIPERAFSSADRQFTTEDAATLAFAQALIGNFDWCVRFSADDTYRCDARHPLWNVIAVDLGGGHARPVLYDFDVTGMVAGSHTWFGDVFNAAFLPSRSPHAVEVVSQVQRTRTLFGRRDLDATRARFMAHRDAAYRALDGSDVDDDGRAQIREYLDAFFSEIASDDAFYRPVVVARDVPLRTQPDGAAVCTSQGSVPRGTPVSEPLERRGAMIQVVLLDALWHWAPPARCDAVRRGAVWLPADSIGRDVPPRE